MPCYFPLQGYRARHVNESGKRSIVFSLKSGFHDLKVELPCGQCIGCRLERSRQWAIRCVHEASLHEDNCFITLTYDNAHLPSDGSLNVRHFQLFMKRLRKRFGDGIRFFHCGEYGSSFGRPHYHAILFNFDFSDKVLWKVSNGQKLFRSSSLESLWTFGYSSVGSCTFESAAYVARYIMKKVTGNDALFHYSDIDFDTGEILNSRKSEYTTMSRRPGIASDWFDKFKSDVFPHDLVVLRNKKFRPPKFYDSKYELLYPNEMEVVKRKRKLDSKSRKEDNTPDRLEVKRKIKEIQLSYLVRNVDKDL